MFQCTNSWPVVVWNIHLRRAVQEFSYSTIFRKLVYLNYIRTGHEFWNHGEQVRVWVASPAASRQFSPRTRASLVRRDWWTLRERNPPFWEATGGWGRRLWRGRWNLILSGGAAGGAVRQTPARATTGRTLDLGSEGWGRIRAQCHIAIHEEVTVTALSEPTFANPQVVQKNWTNFIFQQ